MIILIYCHCYKSENCHHETSIRLYTVKPMQLFIVIECKRKSQQFLEMAIAK